MIFHIIEKTFTVCIRQTPFPILRKGFLQILIQFSPGDFAYHSLDIFSTVAFTNQNGVAFLNNNYIVHSDHGYQTVWCIHIRVFGINQNHFAVSGILIFVFVLIVFVYFFPASQVIPALKIHCWLFPEFRSRWK